MAGEVVEPAQSDAQRDELATITARLEAAAADLAAKEQAVRLSRRLRDELIVEAVETGMPVRQAARSGGVHYSRVGQILAAN